MVEILEGLKAGDEVVTAGQNRLFNGMSVNVDNTIDPTKSANKQADAPMSFSDLFIRRPVLSTVLACMILLLGFQGIFNLSIRQYPKVDETAITITTAYPGASADLIQGFISAPIARAVASTENIDYVTSSSRPSLQHRDGADEARLRSRRGADRSAVQGPGRARHLAGRLQGPGHRQGHRPAVRDDVHLDAESEHDEGAADRIYRARHPARACRRSRASPTCRSSAPRNTRCASGSIRSGLRRAA